MNVLRKRETQRYSPSLTRVPMIEEQPRHEAQRKRSSDRSQPTRDERGSNKVVDRAC
jgi:hypothetical protein